MVDGKPCSDKTLENLLGLFHSVRIVAPPIAQIAGCAYYLRRAGSNEWVKIEEGDTVYLSLGDSIRTEGAMEVSLLPEGPLELLGGYDMRIAANTTFTVRPTRMELVWGKIRSIFRGPKAKYEIRTPVLVLGVRGTDFITDVEERQTVLLVLNGSVEARDVGATKNVTVKAGEMLTATLSGVADPCRFDTGVLGGKYRSLFNSQEEIDSVVGAIPEVPLLLVGCIMAFLPRRSMPTTH